MAKTMFSQRVAAALARLDAEGSSRLRPSTVQNVRKWLTEPYLAEFADRTAQLVLAGDWETVDEAFWKVIEFGTGGRRGAMFPVGTAKINDRTIGESAKGLADYVKSQVQGGRLACAVAYDTRHRSRHFARLVSEIMAAEGFRVFFLSGYRSTPELSFAVRYKKCHCGIMVTASHNPPSDNAVKVYWSTGGQLLPPHDQRVIRCVMSVRDIRRMPFQRAVKRGRIVLCQAEVDAAFRRAVVAQSQPGPRDVRIIYSPLHGVGKSAVVPALKAAGFRHVAVYGPHAAPDGRFPNVPDHVANPENARVFDPIIVTARRMGAELILATDPDCDRLGCAAPVTFQPDAPWKTLTGNQIGALLADYLLERAAAAGTLTRRHYVVKTIVTTELIRRIADHYGVTTVGNLMVGFKHIGGQIEKRGPEQFVFGAEESYGFLAGAHVRDKDGAVASLLVAELAARLKADGRTLHQKLDALLVQHGCHAERTISVTMPGAAGMERMAALMARLRDRPPESLGGHRVVRVRDFRRSTVRTLGGTTQRLAAPRGDLVMLDFDAEGNNCVGVRPSGTEAKVKFYMFAYDLPGLAVDLEDTKAAQNKRLAAVEADLRGFALQS